MTRLWTVATVGGALLVAVLLVIVAREDGVATAAQPRIAPPAYERVDGRVVFAPGARPTLTLPGGASRQVSSLLDVRRTLRYGDFLWNETRVPAGRVWVRVDLDRQILSVFRGSDEIGTTVILYGADGMPTPLGRFPIKDKRRDYFSNTYGDAPMPFSLWLTDDGVAIHGSPVEAGSATHGCIGVPEAFAAKLFDAVRVGDEVLIERAGKSAR